MSFLETCVVIPADVTHCREKDYYEGRLQNNLSRSIDSALCFFFLREAHFSPDHGSEKTQTYSDSLINRSTDCTFLFLTAIFSTRTILCVLSNIRICYDTSYNK